MKDWGTPVDHKREDDIRLKMDQVARGLNPPLFPHNYSLLFLPVLNANRPDLKVVCLTFIALPAWCEAALYRTMKNEVFIREDASVKGPLSSGVPWAGPSVRSYTVPPELIHLLLLSL